MSENKQKYSKKELNSFKETIIKKKEEVLKDMSHPEIDKFAQDILLQYLRVNDEKKP